MEGKSILNCLLLVSFFTAWFWTCLIDVRVPILSVASHRLRHSIESSVYYCPFTLTVEKQFRNGPKEQIMIEGGRGTMFLFWEKIAAVIENARDPGLTIQWFLEQVRLDHLFMDVVSFEYVWLAILCASVVGVFVQLFVFEPFVKPKHAPIKYVQEMQRGESTYINNMMRKFVIEKLLMLAYVIIRNTEKESTVTSGSGSKRPTVFDWSHRVTDASVFAVWFIIVWSVTSVTTAANQRFEMIIGINSYEDDSDSDEEEQEETEEEPTEEKPLKIEPAEDPNQPIVLLRRLLVLLSSCLFTSTALVSFGLTSFKVMHPLYALMFTVESLIVLVRSIYVSYRVAWWQMVSDAAARQAEAFQRRVYMSKRIADVILHSLAAIMYTLYLVVGVIFNGKLIPLVFVARLSHHLHRTVCNISDHFNGLDTSKFLD